MLPQPDRQPARRVIAQRQRRVGPGAQQHDQSRLREHPAQRAGCGQRTARAFGPDIRGRVLPGGEGAKQRQIVVGKRAVRAIRKLWTQVCEGGVGVGFQMRQGDRQKRRAAPGIVPGIGCQVIQELVRRVIGIADPRHARKRFGKRAPETRAIATGRAKGAGADHGEAFRQAQHLGMAAQHGRDQCRAAARRAEQKGPAHAAGVAVCVELFAQAC
ncbi:DUF6545 domain-containing protein [uncultured Paracoccus sp.]|uniref:DUF6545 domain-containing protein n=1 Tax=uncultured Paracoccus sp. TaxID=189685 RepID=UPI00344FDFCA